MLDFNKLIISLILGLIEGLTEFFPISSSGHILFVSKLLNFTDDRIKIFEAIIQCGSVFSIIVIFWNKIKDIICLYKIYYKKLKKRCFNLVHMFLGILPGLIFGIIFYGNFEVLFSIFYIIYGLIAGGFFLLISEVFSLIFKLSKVSKIDDLTYCQAFLIGCFQCFAIFPGFSRLGATVGGGLLVGLNKKVSLEFSFLLAIPAIIGNAILVLCYYFSRLILTDVLFLFIGCVTAFIVSLIVVQFIFKIVESISFFPFVIYRFFLASWIYWVFVI